MTIFGKPSHAIIVLPVAAHAARAMNLRPLAGGHWETIDACTEALNQVLAVMGLNGQPDGLAALRWQGQAGTPPDRWLCGADPVYLEARLDHLWMHAVPDIDAGEFATLVDDLRARLSADRNYTFTALGTCGYFLSDEPMASSAVSAVTADGTAPDRFLPEGPAAAAHDRLQSELQMCLFEAGTNLAREQSGRVPVNALWFWGGGRTPAPTPGLPPLFGNDPLFRGCWLNGNAAQAPWPGRLGDCATKVADSFVAVVPASSGEDDAFRHIRDARQLLRQGIGRVTLLFRDGLAVRLRRGDSLRFWRRRPSSFTAKADP